MLDSGWAPQFSWSQWKQESLPGSVNNLSKALILTETGVRGDFEAYLLAGRHKLGCASSLPCTCPSVRQSPPHGELTRGQTTENFRPSKEIQS